MLEKARLPKQSLTISGHSVDRLPAQKPEKRAKQKSAATDSRPNKNSTANAGSP